MPGNQFPAPVAISANKMYIISIYSHDRYLHYSRRSTTAFTNPPLNIGSGEMVERCLPLRRGFPKSNQRKLWWIRLRYSARSYTPRSFQNQCGSGTADNTTLNGQALSRYLTVITARPNALTLKRQRHYGDKPQPEITG